MITGSQREILDALRGNPMTRREIEMACNRRSGSVCARVSELMGMKKIRVRGYKIDQDTKRRVEILGIKRGKKNA